MTCFLRISGRHLDVDKLVKNSPLRPCNIYRKGEPSFRGSGSNTLNKSSGLSVAVSKADFDKYDKQIKNAIRFLTKHKASIKKLTFNKHVDHSCLDFGIYLRIGYENVAIQSDSLPHQLLKLAGDLKLDITTTLYPPDIEEQTEERVRNEK